MDCNPYVFGGEVNVAEMQRVMYFSTKEMATFARQQLHGTNLKISAAAVPEETVRRLDPSLWFWKGPRIYLPSRNRRISQCSST
jgi:hypothetical protein